MDSGDLSADRIREELAENLADLSRYRMPFGRYKDLPLYDLPYEYLHWFPERADGFPKGRLGELMEFVYHTKANGAEMIFSPLKKQTGSPDPLK
ncbi:MAG: cytoplasmic protein [Verrucomicrobiales bacterium]|nr:cytoplasmic protein [Verrucomicrobiales bacterium]